MANSALIRFDRVSVSVHGKSILAGISFAVNVGEKAVFRGKSGSGKSTVLKTLLGLYRVTSGRIFFEHEPLDSSTVKSVRRRAAYIGQEPVLGAETVREALMLPFRFKTHRGNEPSDRRLNEVLARLHLSPDILARECRLVSGGEKQRIAIARALLLGKSLYLLDEVTSALDDESKQAVLNVFADPSFTVLSVAHDPDWVARCDLVLELEGGRLARIHHNGNT
ncbi:ATP-binding cassette domain-containing protein [Methylocaldum szegediense]|uniref:ABC transporter ATP-binding protein n=1 Tax=Methylocaldum szegediense TaxID=73780 RepID=UPI00042960CB|nr:ABC transporter ATP-binding protein [Methylocaldum szegediense]